MTKPLKTTKTAWGTYVLLASEPAAPHMNPQTKEFEPATKTLTKVTEGKKVWWHVGWGVLACGLCAGGGMIFKTKKAALATFSA